MTPSPVPSNSSSQSSAADDSPYAPSTRKKVSSKRKASSTQMSSRESPEEHPAVPPPKKKAGRKKATQDGDAVERRRTQLRLAQRAYRERKESTIAELEKKSASLERALSDVFGILSDYQDAASTGRTVGREGGWVQEIANVRQRVDTAVQAAGVQIDAASTARAGRQDQPLTTTGNTPGLNDGRRNEPFGTGVNLQQADMLGYHFDSNPAASSFLPLQSTGHAQQLQQQQQQPQPQSQTHLSGPMNIGNSNSHSNSHSSSSSSSSSSSIKSSSPPTISSTTDDTADDLEIVDINPQTSSTLDALFSSDWLNSTHLGSASGFKNETVTFARRLFHYCLESCYRMMTDPHHDPEVLNRKMRFSLLFYQKDDILTRVRQYLQSSKDPNFTPDPGLIPWGNAGCHYPRSQFLGSTPNKFRIVNRDTENEELEYLHSQGLYKYSPVDPSRFPEEFIPDSLPGPTGQAWFDSYDTEIYLRQRGLQFDNVAQSATIEVEFDEPNPPPFAPSLSGSPAPVDELNLMNFGNWHLPDMDSVPDLAWSPRSVETGDNNISAADNLLSQWDLGPDYQQSLGLVGTVGDELGIAGLDDIQTFLPTATSTSGGTVQSQRSSSSTKVKRMVTIDVDHLISLLEQGAVCLGRAPGFRKSVVDNALEVVMGGAW